MTDLLTTGLALQRKIYLPLLAVAGFFFLIGVVFFTFFKWTTKRQLANPNSPSAKQLQFYKRVTLGSLWASIGLSLASAVSTTEVSTTCQLWSVEVAKSSIFASAGIALQVLQWLVVGLSVLFALATTSILSDTGFDALPGPGGFGGPPMPGGPPSMGGPGFPSLPPPPGLPLAPPPPF